MTALWCSKSSQVKLAQTAKEWGGNQFQFPESMILV